MRVLIWALACVLVVLPAAARADADGAFASLTVPTLKPAPPLDPHAPLDAWKGAQPVAMPWDVTHQRPASEPSSALISTDGEFLYLRFDVKQREGLLAVQHTNNVGDGTDDEVWIDLWPNGANGFFYQFAATSNGTHFQYSSENTAYAPSWESYGASFDGGFTVTEKVPLRVIRGSSSGTSWRAQFVRVIRSTGERQIWSYDKAQTNGDDVNYAGPLRGLIAAAAAGPQPRLGLYGLGSAGPANSGLTTSRVGADFSIPITATSSFYSTLHPDYSNLEIDQQTITPSAFTRFFQETRPFFTQGSSYYNNFNCDACPGITELYTPNIPTPRSGYAVEGKQGQIGYAAFDAVGVGRSDAAQAFSLRTSNNQLNFTAQRVATDILGNVHDDLLTTGLNYNDNKHVNAYFNYGSDSGSNVSLGNQAQRYDGGAYVYTNTFGAAVSARKLGYYYNPVDGLVQHPDVAGYAAYMAKILLFPPESKLNSVGISGFMDRYHNFAGELDQTDNNILFDLLTRNRIDAQISLGSSYLLANNCATSPGNLINVTPLNYALFRSCQLMTPITQSGASLTWHSGTVNNPGNFPGHGSSSTPVTVSYNTGRFGPGRVTTWTRSATLQVGSRGVFSSEIDDTKQYLDWGTTDVQWLERFGYTHTFGPDTSLSFGVRRVIGIAPFIVSNAPSSCVTYAANSTPTTPCSGAWNLSLAFHKRTPKDEFYFAYGDAAQLSTVPQWVFKWIHYFGAEKGT